MLYMWSLKVKLVLRKSDIMLKNCFKLYRTWLSFPLELLDCWQAFVRMNKSWEGCGNNRSAENIWVNCHCNCWNFLEVKIWRLLLELSCLRITEINCNGSGVNKMSVSYTVPFILLMRREVKCLDGSGTCI